jgi:hypothetical protein
VHANCGLEGPPEKRPLPTVESYKDVSTQAVMDELDRVLAGVDRHRQRMHELNRVAQALDSILGTREPLPAPDAEKNLGKLIIDSSTDSR